jgi:hypothetical protein
MLRSTTTQFSNRLGSCLNRTVVGLPECAADDENSLVTTVNRPLTSFLIIHFNPGILLPHMRDLTKNTTP